MKRSRRLTLIRYAAVFFISTGVVAVALHLHREWTQFRRTSYAIQCRSARDAGNWVELQRLGEQWTQWDPVSGEGWLFRADAAQHQGNFSAAAKYLGSVPESDPKSLPTMVSLSALQFNTLDRPLDGVKTCERLLQREPRTTAAHEQLIEFYALTLQRRRLEHQIRFAIECSREPPNAYVYLLLIDTMRLENGVESNNRWLTQFPDSELFLVARVLQLPEPDSGIKNASGDDKYSLADSLFEQFPQNLELLAYKIDLSIRRGNVEELMSLLLSLPAEADVDPRFWRAKGWLHLTRDEITKAKSALAKAIELYPMDWNARNWMADALRSEGNLADAEPFQEVARQARSLRQRITSGRKDQNTSTEILEEIAEFAGKCGEKKVYEALNRRLGRRQSVNGGIEK